MKKNEIIEVDIIDNGFKGEGIAKYEDHTIFIPGLIKGEVAKVKILKVQILLVGQFYQFLLIKILIKYMCFYLFLYNFAVHI